MWLIILSGFLISANAEQNWCTYESSYDISDSQIQPNKSIIHNGIEYLENQWYEHIDEDNTTSIRGCICLIKDCLWKCCPDGEAHFGRPCEVSSDPMVNPFNVEVYSWSSVIEGLEAKDHFTFFYGNPCQGARYILDPSVDKFYLQKDGVLYQPGASATDQYHSETTFCMDLFELDPTDPNNTVWEPRVMSVVCFGDEVVEAVGFYWVYAIGLLISVPFLMATLAVYAFVPELRNLHGKCLMAYISGLIVAFSFLAYLQLHTTDVRTNMTGCHVIAFVVFYAFMSSFFWLNVMCFDIWRTFSRYGGASVNPARDRRRFLYYGAYAWGMAAILTSVTALMQFHEGIPSHHVRPGFGRSRCWFDDRRAEMVYFYTPAFALVVVNCALFGVTARSIARIRRETAILKSSESARTDQYETDKQRYALYLKLFVVMGVNWTLEVLSFLIAGSAWVWLVGDFTNCFLGIFIFVIFVWKNKVRNLLVKRYRRVRYGSERVARSWARDSTAHTEDTRVSEEHHLSTVSRK